MLIFVAHVVSVYVDDVETVSSGPGDNHFKVSVGVVFRGFGDKDIFPDQNGQASASGYMMAIGRYGWGPDPVPSSKKALL